MDVRRGIALFAMNTDYVMRSNPLNGPFAWGCFTGTLLVSGKPDSSETSSGRRRGTYSGTLNAGYIIIIFIAASLSIIISTERSCLLEPPTERFLVLS